MHSITLANQRNLPHSEHPSTDTPPKDGPGTSITADRAGESFEAALCVGGGAPLRDLPAASVRLAQNWRKERLGEEPLGRFVPVVVAPEASGDREMASTGGRMEVVTANGRRVVVGPDFDPRALGLLLKVLEQP